ncbi:MAG: hypothetical protein ACRD3I_07690, partial [Terriglobales bacterium]
AEGHQVGQTRRANNASIRWPMHATKALMQSQRASRALAALQITTTTFIMHAMVGRYPPQLKMPRQDA